eukprot:6474465-Amphidinium_carterae.1
MSRGSTGPSMNGLSIRTALDLIIRVLHEELRMISERGMPQTWAQIRGAVVVTLPDSRPHHCCTLECVNSKKSNRLCK